MMKIVDPKMSNVLLQMLTFNEMEKILTDENSEHVLLFSPCQLLVMIRCITDRSTKLSQACLNIAIRFQEELTSIKNRSANNGDKLAREDLAELGVWLKNIRLFLEGSFATSKKYLLVDLFVGIVLAAKPFINTSELDQYLAQTISVDLSRQPDFSNLCKGWSRCMSKFSQLSGGLHADLLSRFKTYVAAIPPETCFDVYLTDAGEHSNEISEVLFERAITLFQVNKETSYIWRAYDLGKNFFGSESNNRAKNLGRLFSRCIGDLFFDERTQSSVVRSSTELPSTSNMMKFFPKLLELKVLEKGTDAKVNLILKQVFQVRMA
jgi:hypothetical protein